MNEYSIFQIIRIKHNYHITDKNHVDFGSLYDCGTGFFISPEGHFLTAGHVLEQKENVKNYAIIESSLYEISIHKIEYIKIDNPEWIDYAIGMINYKTINYFNLSNISKNTENNLIVGFTRSLTEKDDAFLIKKVGNDFGLYKINAFISDNIFRNKQTIFKNAYTVGFETSSNPKGMSGAPFLDKDFNVLGIFVWGKVYLFGSNLGRVFKIDSIKNQVSKYVKYT
jgi:hypothetical protein